MEAAGDHQVQHQPEIAFDADGDALADAAHGNDLLALDRAQRRIDGAQQEDRAEPHPLERLAENASLDGGDVGGDVGQFRHGVNKNSW